MIRSVAIAHNPALDIRLPRIGAAVRRASLARPLLLLALVGALASFLYIGQASGVATTGYDIQTLETQKRALQARNEQARARVAALESLDRIEREARARLQMASPKQVLFVVVDAPRPADAPRDQRTVRSSRSGDRGGAPEPGVVESVVGLVSGAR